MVWYVITHSNHVMCAETVPPPVGTMSSKQTYLLVQFNLICSSIFTILIFQELSSMKILVDGLKQIQIESFMKYILLWTPQYCQHCSPFKSIGTGQSSFKLSNCRYDNCFITRNRRLLGDYTKFNALLFNGRQVVTMSDKEFPRRRSSDQMYVFLQIESSNRFPVCNPKTDMFFNRTFTYKLSSDFVWPYFHVALLNGTVIGPKENMEWIPLEKMQRIPKSLSRTLQEKRKAAAWFVSKCNTNSKRELYVQKLALELERYNLTVDVYGQCGNLNCTTINNTDMCAQALEHDYFFYLSLENSFSEDYVTEKLMTALEHNTVPVVYGGAEYTRFLPPGSYLEGNLQGIQQLAETMYELIRNVSMYEDMFRWRSHYRYVRVWPPPLCQLCEHLHIRENSHKVYENFRTWWNPRFFSFCMEN